MISLCFQDATGNPVNAYANSFFISNEVPGWVGNVNKGGSGGGSNGQFWRLFGGVWATLTTNQEEVDNKPVIFNQQTNLRALGESWQF